MGAKVIKVYKTFDFEDDETDKIHVLAVRGSFSIIVSQGNTYLSYSFFSHEYFHTRFGKSKLRTVSLDIFMTSWHMIELHVAYLTMEDC